MLYNPFLSILCYGILSAKTLITISIFCFPPEKSTEEMSDLVHILCPKVGVGEVRGWGWKSKEGEGVIRPF